MSCCALLCVHSGIAIILIGMRELVALLSLSYWCLMIVVWPRVCLQFVIVVFPDHTHLLYFVELDNIKGKFVGHGKRMSDYVKRLIVDYNSKGLSTVKITQLLTLQHNINFGRQLVGLFLQRQKSSK